MGYLILLSYCANENAQFEVRCFIASISIVFAATCLFHFAFLFLIAQLTEDVKGVHIYLD